MVHYVATHQASPLSAASPCHCKFSNPVSAPLPVCPLVQATAGGRGSLGAAAPLGVSRDEDGGRYYSTKRGAFHEVFNLPETEQPLTGGRGSEHVISSSNSISDISRSRS